MSLDDALELLAAKLEVMAELADREEVLAPVRVFQQVLDGCCHNPRLSMAQLRCFDREGPELVMKWNMTPASRATIRARLVARFGVSRISSPDRAVIQRVLKRGEVADIEEYYQLQDVVAMGPESAGISEEKFSRIDSMVEAFDGPEESLVEPEPIPEPAGGKKSRRIPPPPFDLTLEPDEKLCPPETPIERRVEFIRAKYSKILACPMGPRWRESLESQLKSGMEFFHGPMTKPEKRAERLEWCEHEAEYFGGYEVNGAQHRAIERELEKEFGFRRLGPTAQVRLARLLAAGEPGTYGNRIFIERFIAAYPHQNLFSSSELKRATGLLKERPSKAVVVLPPPPSRPQTAGALHLLCPGAVFRVPFDERPVRVLSHDEVEVFYDIDWGGDVDWELQKAGRKTFFYRYAALWFLDGAERLRIDPLPADVLAAVRPDLPLRFGRSSRLAWRKGGFATKPELEDYVRATDPDLLREQPLRTGRVKLYPYSARGAMKPGVLVKAPGDAAIPFLDLLWHACLHQAPFANPTKTGIGFFRMGFERDGTPSYYLGGYDDEGGATRWHREARLAE